MENKIEGITSYNIPNIFLLQNKLVSIVIEHFLKENTFGVKVDKELCLELEAKLETYLKKTFSFKFETISIRFEENIVKGEIKVEKCPPIVFKLKSKE